MNPDESAAAKEHETEEDAVASPDGEAADDSMRQLITLAIMAAAIIAFLALCLPVYIL
jgi:DNA-binding GntR family transcriptional regulator